jgi:hypothetical protein
MERLNPPRVGPSCCFETYAEIAKSAGETGRSVVILEIIRSRKTKLGFVRDSESYRSLGEVEGSLPSVASLLKPVFKLEASTRDDDA